MLANILRSHKQLKESLKTYQKAIELNSFKSGIFFNQSMALYDNGELEEALKALKKAIDLDPT
jgi:tetratricopeptide (TPR) repeat protein